MRTGALVGLTLAARRRRILLLAAFGIGLLAVGTVAAIMGRGPGGRLQLDPLFATGGYPLVSGIILAGWVLGRFPLIAALALVAGLVSDDRATGQARLLAVRGVSPVTVYGTRLAALLGVAFALSAVVMPAFDLIMLGTWAGPATLVLIAAQVLVYGGLTAFLSVWTRLDAWLALLAALAALGWTALGNAGLLPHWPVLSHAITLLLPPQSALTALEGAFANVQPIPWDAFAFCAGYSAVAIILAGLALRRREM
ncbi:MAG: hypothetical protein P8174_04230 [Gemmatimonadota bacterium]